MKIGFDVSQTGKNKAGCGFFADSLILALTAIDEQNSYILYPNFGTSFYDPEGAKSTRKINHPNISRTVIGKNRSEVESFWENLHAESENVLGSPDIIHANNYSCPKGLTRARLVYTLYDLNFLQFPEFSTEQNRWICFNGVLDASLYADFIISISNFSRDMFLKVFPHYPSDRIKVAHLGSRIFHENNGHRSPSLKGLEPDQFWLAVGTLEPRKNLRRLLKAYAVFLKKSETCFPLALAGGKGWLEEDLENYIKCLDLTRHVKILGYVTDSDLFWLYKNCFAFIYPSIYEGFGLPVLEAMCMGAPVITSNTTAIPEVGGDAVYYVDPHQASKITEAFSIFESNNEVRLKFKRLSVKQSQKFSWNRCASEVLDVYREVIKMPKRL